MKTTIKISTLIVNLLFFFISNYTNAQCHIDDWTALKALYESTDGDNWLVRTGWNTQIDNQTSPPANCNLSNLYGVTLSGQRVSCLDLDGVDNCDRSEGSGNFLNGNLPPEIDNLSFLTKLHLSNNFLQNSIPPEIGNLSFLTELGLRHNFLSGSIPNELGNLTFLVELDLVSNQLTGSIPTEFGNLIFMKNLSLDSNSLYGSIPTQLGNLTQLNGLTLSGNQLSGGLPIELSNLINLEGLYLSGNLFSGNLPDWLCNLINLEDVKLGHNQFIGELPSCLCNLTNMKRLEIDHNGLWGSYPPCYTQFCTQFTSIYFDCNFDISDGNNFDITWEDFCANTDGKCGIIDNPCGCMDSTACNYNTNVTCDDGSCIFGDVSCPDPCNCISTPVWPGDLNYDGICNNQDFSLSHLYIGETGTIRNAGGFSWEAQPCEDWGIPQANGQDIKHHDCDGNDNINTNDANAININYGKTHPLPPSISPIPQFSDADYQVELQPVGQIQSNSTSLIDLLPFKRMRIL